MRRAAIIILIAAALSAVLLSYCTAERPPMPDWPETPPVTSETAESAVPLSSSVTEPEDPVPPVTPELPKNADTAETLALYSDNAEKTAAHLTDYGNAETRLRLFLDNCSPMKIMLPSGYLGAVCYPGGQTSDEQLAEAAEEYNYPASSLTVEKPYISVYYRDLETGYEFGYNENDFRDCASLAKTPYLLAVLEEIDEHSSGGGRYDLSAEWTYDPATMFREGSGVIFEMDAGTTMTWRDLIGYSFTDSDNIAFGQLTYRFGYASFYKLVSDLGIRISLENRLMSAKDCGTVLARAYEYINGGSEYGKLMKDKMIEAKKRNNVIGNCFPDTPVCHKYGWDLAAYHDSAIVLDEHPYVVVIMTDYDTGGEVVDRYCADVVEMIKALHVRIPR